MFDLESFGLIFGKKKPTRLKGEKLEQLNLRVLQRDGWKCQNPECPGGYSIDRPHHIIFRSQGGSDTMENLITLCRHCHGKQHGVNVK